MAKRKYYSVILIILLISVMALAQESITVNGILANYTELNTSRIFRIYDTSLNEILLSEDGLYLSHVNGGINEIKISSTSTQFSTQIDMQGNDIINCGNCDTPDNEKMNKSGDTMTGAILFNMSTPELIVVNTSISRIIDTGTGAITFRSGLSLFSRTYTSAFNLTSVQAGSRFVLNMTNALCLSGCGVSALAQLTDSRGTVTVGKFAFSKIDDSLNNTKVQFFVRANTSDSPANTLAFEASNTSFSVPILSGTGNAYICVDSIGNFYRGNPTC